MSTRYVWGKYSTSPNYGVSIDSYGWFGINAYDDEDPYINGNPHATLYLCKYSSASSEENSANSRIKLSGLTSCEQLISGEEYDLSNTYFCFSENPLSGDVFANSGACYYEPRYLSSSQYYAFTKESNNRWIRRSGSGSGYGYSLELVIVSYSKGSFISTVSGTSQSSYPSDGVKGSYWYTYLGSDSIDPTAVGYNKTTPKGGESITINVTPKSNTYGGTITYKYEVQLSGGTWTNIGSTTSTAKSYVIPKGTTTFAARVVASDDMGFTSTTYMSGSTVTVTNNVAPVISGTNSNLGTFTYNPPVISYVVTDENNDTVTVTTKLDNSTLETKTITLGQTYTIPISWWDINTGSHTVTITANDGQGGTATRTYTFTKNSVGQISFNRLHKKTNTGYQTTYIETDSDSIITNNGQILSERLSDIADKLSVSINTSPAEMVLRHRLHIKLTSEYTIDYLEMYSTNIKVGSSTLESVLVQLESKVGISNSGTVPSNLNFERWRMKNSSGTYDIIYLEGISEHVIRPCGKTVEESLQAIEAKL